MNPKAISLVQNSLFSLIPMSNEFATDFYDRLFEIVPEAREMFSNDMAGQNTMLMAALASAVGALRDLDAIVPMLQRLGIRHAGYGVEAEHYDTFGTALLDTLEKRLGDEWSPELRDAWEEVYDTATQVMKGATVQSLSVASSNLVAEGYHG